ncbi:MAG: VCBS repeat-containing protein [Winogradskyella sp.]|uniref:FG-GAP repeat domain-containing protein n=1 Tax=Winogradskyella sp. TaxID=1883156 RepID=UPI0017BB73CA|nr:VCBS repeat-containing protein [Winogradskyella sp.]MBT8243989.1 VCBS repeat-containing protein [Winogradskyella sp.]NNK22486.1 VCBS repeat-containing protein [Winogradskyella sp.]
MKKIAVFCSLVFATLTSNGQQFTEVAFSRGVERVTTMQDLFGSGISIADYDNDGDLDFFVGTEFNSANQLYQNDGNGFFQEVAMSSGITSTYRNRAALWFDYNGDELLDLVLLGDCSGIGASCTEKIEIFLYEQTPGRSFNEITNSGLSFGTRYSSTNISEALVGGMATADINNDGWLDLAITVWGREFAGAQATFFLNNGNGTFTDISVSSGFGQSSVSRYQPIFHDFNRDGFQDIYVNVDFSENEFC